MFSGQWHNAASPIRFGACPHRANPVWCFSPVSVVLCERVLFGVVGEAFTTVKDSVECLLALAYKPMPCCVASGSLLLSPLWLWQLSVCEGPCTVLLALAWIDVCACVVGLQAMWLTIVEISVGKLLAYMFGVVCLFGGNNNCQVETSIGIELTAKSAW